MKNQLSRSYIARRVWVDQFGSIPKGYVVHHKDKNRNNNHISNLEAKSPLAHAREHRGYKFIDGKWYKQCGKCGEYLLLSAFPPQGNSQRKKCKGCFYIKPNRVFRSVINIRWQKVLICICVVCKHQWTPRKKGIPLRCGRCKSPYWNKKKEKKTSKNAKLE